MCAATPGGPPPTPGSSSASWARLMISFSAQEAVNVDGGGSASFVHRHLLNRPYPNVDQPASESRPVVTALRFDPA